MKKLGFKKLTLIILTIIICLTFFSFGNTQLGYKKVMDVWHGSVKVNYNNKDVTDTVTPIIIDGTTYLPLRKMTTLFNKSLLWNDTAKTAIITDNASTDATINDLRNQLAIKDADIARLQEEIKALTTGKVEDIEDLEDKLNKDHSDYNNVDFTITLSGDKDDITVTIRTDKEDWNALSSSKRTTYLQGIVDDILDEFKNADIEGIMKDGSKQILQFTVNSSKKVVLKNTESTVYSLYDALNDKLVDDYFGKMRRIDNEELYIELEGDTDDLIFFINIDIDYYDSQWEDLLDDKDDIEDFMKEIYEYIVDQDAFEDANVIGYFRHEKDGERLVKVYKSGSSLKYTYFNY
ncbi:MAG: hypothetical protein GX285_08525 [Clostridiales bacterium]|nr:hypothetical protein [Clostridiales bacterium]